jgi:hypothetical protein
VSDVPRELSRFFAATGAEGHENCGVAVDAIFDVERRFAVSDEEADRHRAKLPAADRAMHYKAKVTASPERCDDTTIAPRGLLVGMEANVMIQALRSLTEEEHRKRAVAASAWAGEQ